ncbi:MAG: PKD domain-containing protein [Bacteroidota bacterium]
MKVRLLITLFLVFQFVYVSSGQKEDNIWLFGGASMNAQVLGYQFGNTVLDFNEIDPRIYYDSLITMDFAGTNSSVSNGSGSLLLYTNGMQIHDSYHQYIEKGDTIAYSELWESWTIEDYYDNGDDWLLGFPTVQGAQLLPLGESEEHYILLYQILTREEDGFHVTSLNYSLITRMSNIAFKVTKKDEIIRSENLNYGQIHTCLHGNGRDWWLIQQNEEGSLVYIYSISEEGIRLHNTVEKESRGEVGITSNQTSFSPNGELYAVANGQYLYDVGGERGTVIRVFNFDRCAGTLIELGTDTTANYGIRGALAFSPSGRYMYGTSEEEIYQYDMYAEDWASSRKIIAENDGFTFQYTEESHEFPTLFGSMALAPDGRIYSVPAGSNRFVHVIEYPDEEGMEAVVNQHKIMMPTENHTSIPNFPHYRMGPKVGSECDTLGIKKYLEAQFRYESDTLNYLNVRFTDVSYTDPETWLWEFGDGTTYDGKKPYYHEYEKAGAYNACLTISRGIESSKYCKTLYLGVTNTLDGKLNENQVILYPNPVRENLQIEIRDYWSPSLKLVVYDNLGVEIFQQKLKSRWTQINLEQYSSGMYHYVIKEGRINKYQDTFIKM